MAFYQPWRLLLFSGGFCRPLISLRSVDARIGDTFQAVQLPQAGENGMASPCIGNGVWDGQCPLEVRPNEAPTL